MLLLYIIFLSLFVGEECTYFYSRQCFTISICVPGSNLSNPQALLLNNCPVSNTWLSGSYIHFNDRFIVSHILEAVPLNQFFFSFSMDIASCIQHLMCRSYLYVEIYFSK